MKLYKTERGFYIGKFYDRTKAACSIQESSIATENCIWLGIDNANPLIMAVDALNIGLPINEGVNGWIPFPIPQEVIISTRMHLTIDNVKELIPLLQRFLATGSLVNINLPKDQAEIDRRLKERNTVTKHNSKYPLTPGESYEKE